MDRIYKIVRICKIHPANLENLVNPVQLQPDVPDSQRKSFTNDRRPLTSISTLVDL